MSERSAIVVVKRSSQNSITAAVRRSSSAAKRRALCAASPSLPSSVRGKPITTLSTRRSSISRAIRVHMVRGSFGTVASGDASVHVSSETASPTRTEPTSMPRTRVRPVPTPAAVTVRRSVSAWAPRRRRRDEVLVDLMSRREERQIEELERRHPTRHALHLRQVAAR